MASAWMQGSSVKWSVGEEARRKQAEADADFETDTHATPVLIQGDRICTDEAVLTCASAPSAIAGSRCSIRAALDSMRWREQKSKTRAT